jgi:hypothetical protein
MKQTAAALINLLTVLIIFASVSIPAVHADDHYKFKNKNIHSIFDKKNHKEDHGNETTGLFAAWLLAAANINILVGFFIRKSKNYLPQNKKKFVKKISRMQSVLLRPLHYILNPLALSFALVHFIMSACRSSSLPELGFFIMVLTATAGLMLKFNFFNKYRRFIYKFHTSLIPLSIFLAVLLAGHMIID